jgi:choline-sulfatase
MKQSPMVKDLTSTPNEQTERSLHMKTKPNVIWIYCDELRADALSCYGAPTPGIETPTLDMLAENGQIFRNNFTNSPICVPARVAILTGLYPEQNGVYGNEGAWPDFRLSRSLTTFTEMLSAAGYAVANFGKIHVPQEMKPFAHHDGSGGGMNIIADPVKERGGEIITPEHVRTMIGGRFPEGMEYPARAVTDNALTWIANTDGPFCARLSYLQPHTPVFPPPPYDTLYANEPFRSAYTERTTCDFERRFAELTGPDSLSADDIFRTQQYYYGLVRWIDDEISRLLKGLESLDRTRDTMIVFSADHGASLGEGSCFAKHTFVPHVHRVPLIVHWPGTIQPADRTDIAQGIDLAPTLLSACGVTTPEEMEGRNLFSDPAPKAVYATIGHGLPGSRAYPNVRAGSWLDDGGWPRRVCVRTGDFRLDLNTHRNGRPVPETERDIFLADCRNDPSEVVNLAGNPETRETEARLLDLALRHASRGISPTYVDGADG